MKTQYRDTRIDRPYVEVCESHSDMWLEARREGVTGSDIPILMAGRLFGKGPIDIYMSKKGTDHAEPDNERMRYGRILEAQVISDFKRESKFADGCVIGHNVLVANRSFPWMRCTLDGWILREGSLTSHEGSQRIATLEAKTTGNLALWDEVGIPDHVNHQCQWQLAVTGLKTAFVAVFGGGFKGLRFLWREIDRDQELIEEMMGVGEAFWCGFEAGEPPAATGSDEDNRALGKLYAPDDGLSVILPGEFTDLDELIESAKVLGKRQKEIVLKAQGEIKQRMGEATEAVLPNGVRYTWKANAKGTRTFRRHESFRDSGGMFA